MPQRWLDLFMLVIALGLMVAAARTAVTTRSTLVRAVIVAIMILTFALMFWNLLTHGGLHAV
jgi:hypothetical protein